MYIFLLCRLKVNERRTFYHLRLFLGLLARLQIIPSHTARYAERFLTRCAMPKGTGDSVENSLRVLEILLAMLKIMETSLEISKEPGRPFGGTFVNDFRCHS
jgi:hypothetical protein